MNGFLRSLSIWLALLLVSPSWAQTVKVTAGEHEGFTRLVMSTAAIGPWKVGRTAEGYGLLLDPAFHFDLTDAFRLIGRSRLSAIWPDPSGELLHFRVPCECHVTAFLDGPGVLVIDLRDGPAQAGSAFEAALMPGELPALQRALVTMRPRARPPEMAIRGPSWAEVVWNASRVMPSAGPVGPDSHALARNEALLQPLVAELARGAARGVVDFAPPGRPTRNAEPTGALPDGLASHLGSLPGIAVVGAPEDPAHLTEGATTCIPDERVAISGWGDDRPVWQQLAAATALPGEFDRPDPERRNKAVRLLLYLGFGLEAQRLIESMPLAPDAAGDDPIYLSLATILDGGEPKPGPLARQEACDSGVALWALLADPDPEAREVDAAAVRRGFSVLPPHLRRLLGPDLVERFLALDDPASARDIQAAMERPGGPLPADVAVSGAELALHANQPEAALSAVAAAPAIGPGSVDVLMAEVEASIRLGKSLPAETATALAALLAENRGGPDEPALRRILALAQAASGQFEPALAAAPDLPGTAEPIWAMLARADDETLIRYAVGPVGDEVAALSTGTKLTVAARLIDLGLGPAAQVWLGDPPLDTTLAAEAALLAGDARAALRLLSGTDGESATALRQEALANLSTQASDLPLAPSDPRLAAWMGDWNRVAQDADEPWKGLAAELVGPEPEAPAGLIAKGNAVLEQTKATAGAIAKLRAEMN